MNRRKANAAGTIIDRTGGIMSDRTRVAGRPRWSWPPGARAALAIIATAGLVVPAAASAVSQSTNTQKALAYSRCMRSHGVPRYPDPTSNGNLPKGRSQDFGVSNAQFQAAQRACRHLLPNGGTTFAASLTQCLMTGACSAALVHQALTEGLRFARCMRDHGVPNWPDPTIDSMGRPSFQVTAAGISIDSTRSSWMLSKIGHCQDQPGAVLLRQE
jgi:hypothetical protein